MMTGCANSCLGCTNVVRIHHSYPSFLAVKAVKNWNECLLAKNADYCNFIDEQAWLIS